MTDLSYTAWDDNQYPWPPPEGWYQASDGKWWPEGYGPPTDDANNTAAEADDGAVEDVTSASDDIDADGVAFEPDTANDDTEAIAAAHSGESNGVASSDSESSYSDSTYSSGYSSGYRTDYTSGSATEPESTASSDYASTDYTPTSTASDYSSSTYASPSSENVSSGLAGWAQSGSSAATDVTDTVETDVSDTAEAEVEDVASDLSADTDTTVESAMTRLDDLQRKVESQDFGLGAGAAVAGAGVAGLAGSDLADSATDTFTDAISGTATDVSSDTALSDTASSDTVSEAVSDAMSGTAGMSDADDSASGVVTNAMSGGAGTVNSYGGNVSEAVTESVPKVTADTADEMLDPTETLDIDPDELAIDTNPYYGGSDGSDGAYPDQNNFDSAVALGQDQDPAFAQAQGMPADQQVGGVADEYRPQPREYGSNVLTPVSTPPPQGGGKRLLYVVLGLLALAAAGFAGYVLFQLQGDDTDAGAAESETSEAAAGAENLNDQIGSFVNPHQPDKGVRITVPVGEAEQNDWMIEVRELATTSNLDDGDVELMIALRVRNDTATEPLSLENLLFNLVTADGGDAIGQSDACSTGGDLNRSTLIDPGKTEVGTVCWTVPADQVGTALMAVESTTASGRVHVSIS